MPKPREWISFLREPQDPKKKTASWCVVPNVDKETNGQADYQELGIVKWYSPWRRYCFFPSDGSIFEQDCLRRIAAFCEGETTARRACRGRT